MTTIMTGTKEVLEIVGSTTITNTDRIITHTSVPHSTTITVVTAGDPHAKSDRPKKEERSLRRLESYSTNDRVYIQILPLHLQMVIVCPRKCPITDGHGNFLSLFTLTLSRAPKPDFDL
ncbi:hypothetical protein NP493_490g02011 [Ridgeia piscesae]|uniref:Uncharacterized protein n=1 Tax=Ridgeia piscesae TaxID=27915 RepID=A0AAD9NSV2_RIDPI|nr:hypothetical protein NP493_490g02011 [Ridgeia piscesae]